MCILLPACRKYKDAGKRDGIVYQPAPQANVVVKEEQMRNLHKRENKACLSPILELTVLQDRHGASHI